MIPRPRDQIPRLICHSPRAKDETLGLRDQTTCLQDDSSRVLYDPAASWEDSAGVRDDPSSVLCDPLTMREDSAGLVDRLCRVRGEVPRGWEGSPARGDDLPCGDDPLPGLACACARLVLSFPAGCTGLQPENAAGRCGVGSAQAAWAALPYSESFCRIFRIVSCRPNIFVRSLESRKCL